MFLFLTFWRSLVLQFRNDWQVPTGSCSAREILFSSMCWSLEITNWIHCWGIWLNVQYRLTWVFFSFFLSLSLYYSFNWQSEEIFEGVVREVKEETGVSNTTSVMRSTSSYKFLIISHSSPIRAFSLFHVADRYWVYRNNRVQVMTSSFFYKLPCGWQNLLRSKSNIKHWYFCCTFHGL